jgi:hypothetical protein
VTVSVTFNFNLDQPSNASAETLFRELSKKLIDFTGAPTNEMAQTTKRSSISDEELSAILKDATPNVRRMMQAIAEAAPKALTTSELSTMLFGIDEPKTISGLRSVMTRSQKRLVRRGELDALLAVLDEHFEDGQMSYSLPPERAKKVLEILRELGG